LLLFALIINIFINFFIFIMRSTIALRIELDDHWLSGKSNWQLATIVDRPLQ